MKLPRLLSDRVLVCETPEGELKQNGIVLPQYGDDARGFSSHQEGALCIGTVVAVGPGEPLKVYRCKTCGTLKTMMLGEGRKLNLGRCDDCDCPDFDLLSSGRAAMSVKPGDRVIYPHRAGTPIQIPGQDPRDRYFVAYEEQFVYGVCDEPASPAAA
jgi:co-chaperonin GroES (HSP10)